MKKFIPLGSENFPTLIQDSYYVDKTGFLKSVIHSTETTAFLILRPRRFGKSLMLSMAESFFDHRVDYSALFSSLEIGSDSAAMERVNSADVIHLNFKGLGKPTYGEFVDSLKRYVVEQYETALKDVDYSLSPDRAFVARIRSGSFDEIDLASSLSKLTKVLRECDGRDVILLIDEYDAPTQAAYENGYHERQIALLRDFLGNALKGNRYLSKAIITGVLQIAQASIFSGINNLVVDNGLERKEKEYFGFDEAELLSLFSYYETPCDLAKLSEYYGGYWFNGHRMFSPWSILSFLQKGCLYKAYWVNTGSTDIFRHVFATADTIAAFRSLLEGKKVLLDVIPNVSYDGIEEENVVFSLLYYAGYLTCTPSEFEATYFAIPNKEIRQAFRENVYALFVKKPQYVLFDALKEALFRGDEEGVKRYLEEYFLSALSYYDFKDERSYQVLLITLTALLFDDAVVESEANAGEGRLDILIMAKEGTGWAYVFEVKYLSPKSNNLALEASSREALRQIDGHRYYDLARRYGKRPIYLYGFAFAGKRASVKSRILDVA